MLYELMPDYQPLHRYDPSNVRTVHASNSKCYNTNIL